MLWPDEFRDMIDFSRNYTERLLSASEPSEKDQESLISLKVLPSLYSDRSKLGFDWQLRNISETKIDIHLIFDEPIQVS